MLGNVDHPLHQSFAMKLPTLPALTLLALAAMPPMAAAQPAALPPPPGWAGSAGAGLALTSGNSDTSTVNAAYELKRDNGGVIVLKSNGRWSTASRRTC